MKNPFLKLAVGAVLLGVGFVVSMKGQRELIAKWGAPCEDCEDEDVVEVKEEVKDETKEETE